MTGKDLSATPQQITVALDDADVSEDVLETAAALARALGIPLKGLFIEDENFFAAASYAQTNIISSASGKISPWTSDELAASLKARAGRLKRALAAAAARHKVTWEFVCRRGFIAEELLREAEQPTLITVSASSRRRRAAYIGSNVRQVVSRAQNAVLVVSARQKEKSGLFLITEKDSADSPKQYVDKYFANLLNGWAAEISPPENADGSWLKAQDWSKAAYVAISRKLLEKMQVDLKDFTAAIAPAAAIITP